MTDPQYHTMISLLALALANQEEGNWMSFFWLVLAIVNGLLAIILRFA